MRRTTKFDAIRRLKAAQQSGDTEEAHCDADAVLCDLLTTLGYEQVVEEYHKVSKWYA